MHSVPPPNGVHFTKSYGVMYGRRVTIAPRPPTKMAAPAAKLVADFIRSGYHLRDGISSTYENDWASTNSFYCNPLAVYPRYQLL